MFRKNKAYASEASFYLQDVYFRVQRKNEAYASEASFCSQGVFQDVSQKL
ncbi:hypothetical protein [Paenibacillus humicola]|nr:hypothetical protein [Paenibacillus humicola]